MLEIKTASATDLRHVARLRWDFKIEAGDIATIDRNDFERQCLLKLQAEAIHWTHFLAWEGTEVIGMVSCCLVPKILSPDMKGDSISYLTNTYIIPSWRESGVGSKLLRFAIEWAKEKNIEVFFVWPSDRSRSFYGRLGFKEENDIMELGF